MTARKFLKAGIGEAEAVLPCPPFPYAYACEIELVKLLTFLRKNLEVGLWM